MRVARWRWLAGATMRRARNLNAAWIALIWTVVLVGPLRAERVELVWPTPSKAWAEGRPAREFLQHAGSGEWESGGFGGVRSSGRQFHEGIDIKPVARNRRGEPTDEIFAAMSGVVRHVSAVAGNSSYGRYIVIEHTELTPAVYTLYAHLAKIAPGVREGVAVKRGQTIGEMGYTAGGYTIPKERAHLHFEIGLMVTRNFQTWYDARKFGSRNEHGVWNGMNLMGIDPLDFYNAWRSRRVDTFEEYFAGMETAVRLRIATRRVPDFVERYPALLTKARPMLVGGWEIRFNWSGIPFAWTPLTTAEMDGLKLNEREIVAVDTKVERADRSKTLVVQRRGKWVVARDLETVLQQL
ncbi:MAG TPA: M23 family metallopeptidase, partial [Opitutus sp.]|nr:M23 family metallopeptidase [Opitutus sp.]